LTLRSRFTCLLSTFYRILSDLVDHHDTFSREISTITRTSRLTTIVCATDEMSVTMESAPVVTITLDDARQETSHIGDVETGNQVGSEISGMEGNHAAELDSYPEG